MLVVIISFIIRLQRYNKNLKYSYYYLKKKSTSRFLQKDLAIPPVVRGTDCSKGNRKGTDRRMCCRSPFFNVLTEELYQMLDEVCTITGEHVDDRNFDHRVAARLQSHGGTGYVDEYLTRQGGVVDTHVELQTLVLRLAADTLADEVYAVTHITHIIARSACGSVSPRKVLILSVILAMNGSGLASVFMA